MKKTNKLLFTLAIVLTAFIGIKSVNADTIFSPTTYCGDFPKDGDSLITNCSSSGDEADLFDVTVMTWYKGDKDSSSSNDPGESIGTTGVYESGYKYYLELKLKPKDGNEFSENTNFHIIGLSDGTVMNVNPNGEYIVIFEYTVHHIIHFETYGGTHIDDIVVTDWCSFEMPDDPVKDGNTFIGWYLDPEFKDTYYGWCVEESMTFYAKFVPTANVIKNINVTLERPVAGSVVTVTSMTDPEWGAVYENQAPTPIATVESESHYSVNYTSWVEGVCTPEGMAQDLYPCDTKFEGTIMEDTYYYAEIGITTDDGYVMNASDLNIKVNGQDPDEVFTVWDNNYTRFIAKIKSTSSPTMISSNKTSVDFGETYPGLENDAYLNLVKNVKITNTGITTVTLSITNPTTQGFGSNWFDSSKELAPGESMEIGLIPHPSYIYSKVPGTYTANYLITATNVENNEETFQIGISAKVVLLEKAIPKTDLSDFFVYGLVNKTYNGKAQTLNIRVSDGEKDLVLNKDYKITYRNNVNAGTADVLINGIGDYEGGIMKPFKINKANNPLAVTTKTKSVKYTKVKKKKEVVAPITVTKKQGTVTFIKQKGSSSKLTISKTTGKITVKKGTKKGTYKIKVKITANGNKNYKAKGIIKTIKVKVK